MKKSALMVLCLGAAGAAHAQNNVTLYGVVTGGVGYVNKVGLTPASARQTGSRWGMDSGQYTQSRFGMRGTEDLGGGLKANFVIEGGLTIDNGASAQNGATFGRRTTIGLTGSAGSIELGRRKDYTDIIGNQFATTTRMLPFTAKAHANGMDRATGARANNMVFYLTPNWNGFQGNLTYAFGEQAGDFQSGRAFGFGGTYKNGPFAIGAAYWQSHKGIVTAATSTAAATNTSIDEGISTGAGCRTPAAGNTGDACLKVIVVGASYKLGDALLRGQYSHVSQPLLNTSSGAAPNFATTFSATAGSAAFTAGGINNRKAQVFDIGVDYTLGQWLLKAAVIHSRYDFIGASSSGKLTVFAAGADYNLTRRTLLYGMAGMMKASDMYSPGLTSNGAPGVDNSQVAMMAGILHRF